jgi:hypothetical protein
MRGAWGRLAGERDALDRLRRECLRVLGLTEREQMEEATLSPRPPARIVGPLGEEG